MKSLTKLTPLMAAAAMLFVSTAAQAAGNFSVSGGGNHTVGTTFTVVVSENSGAQEVNAVDASVTFNGNVQITGVVAGEFTTCPVAPSASGNTVTFKCAALGQKLTGVHTVGTVTLKAVAAGAASASASGVVVDANTDQAASGISAGGASYNLVAPVTPTNANGGGSTAPKATTAPAAGSKATPTTTPAVAGASATASPTPESDAQAATSNAKTDDAKTAVASASKSKLGLWVVLGGLLAALAAVGAWYAMRRNAAKTV